MKEDITKEYLAELREEGVYHNWFIDNYKEYIIDLSDVCELAHLLLVKELATKGKECSDTENYTDYEQQIFDQYYDLITNTLSI